MSIFDKSVQPLDEQAALEEHISKVLAVEQPGGRHVDLVYKVVKALFDPVILGAEHIPDQPCLFVGNHSLFALDGYILGPVFFRDVGRFVRGLGDRFLFANPTLGDFLLNFGVALGHPEVCRALMQDGHDILVFPGGAYEAVKPASELYQLQWRERYGFVRLAAEQGYTIMPFGTVGPDEMYGHLMEGEELPDSAIGQLLKRFGILTEDTRRDVVPPVPVGALGTLLPKPQRCYLSFGQPIDLEHMLGRTPTRRQQEKIRAEVAEQIEGLLADLLVYRARRRGSESLWRRLLTV